jgi:hypothetical protein
MADLVFRQGQLSQINGITFTVTGNTLNAGGGVGGVQNRDAVRIVYTDGYQKAVYAVCVDQNTGRFEFDSNVYPVGLSSITGTVFPYNNTDIDSVSTYRINIDVENGLYSKAYAQYASNVSYSLIVPAKRNEYFGIAQTLVTNPEVVFVDLCDNKAYGVGFSDGSFDTLNNRFKSTLEFNIATR